MIEKDEVYNIQDLYEENKIDDILENITLIYPKKPFSQFCKYEYERLKKKGVKINIQILNKDLAEPWAKLKEDEKKKYIELYELEKKEYIKSIEIVRHFLFRDYNGVIRRPSTPYQIFLNQKLIEGLDKNLDPKKIKKDASNIWKRMSKDEKKPYFDRKKENDNWFERAKSIRKVSPISIFIHIQISLAKEKKQELPKLEELSKKWNTLKYFEKNKYIKYAEQIKEERQQLQDIYELINGIKPKRPAGAFRLFLQEKAKDKIFNSLKDGQELWARLTEDEKEEYVKKSHKLILAYKYKKMIYNKKIKRILPKKPPNAFFLFIKEKKGQKIPNGQKTLSYWRSYYDKLSENEKEKYQKKAKIEIDKYEKKMEKFKNAIFDMPKKPKNPFALYLKDTLPNLKEKEENKNLPISELVKKASIIWINSELDFKKKYEKICTEDKKRFKKEIKQFEKFGYYIKNTNKENNKNDKKNLNKEDEDENEEVIKRKITKKRSVNFKKTKRGSKRTKSNKK